MTHRIFVPQAPQAYRALARRPLWLIVLLLALWLSVLLLAMQAYPQSAGPEFPNPGNAHMSRDNQRRLGLQAAAQVYQQMPVLPDNSPEMQYIRGLKEFRVALPVLMVLAHPQDVRRMPDSVRFHESRWREAEFKNQEKGYEKNIMRVNGYPSCGPSQISQHGSRRLLY